MCKWYRYRSGYTKFVYQKILIIQRVKRGFDKALFYYKQVLIIIWTIFRKPTDRRIATANECKPRKCCSPAPYVNTYVYVCRSSYSHWLLEGKSHFEDITQLLR